MFRSFLAQSVVVVLAPVAACAPAPSESPDAGATPLCEAPLDVGPGLGARVDNRLAPAVGVHGGEVVVSWSMDDDGSLHVARLKSGAFVDEIVDTGPAGIVTDRAMVVDDAGRVHLAYAVRGTAGEPTLLRYAVDSDTGWSIEEVTELSNDEPSVALALDDSGAPAVSFDSSGIPLRYATRQTTGWVIEDVTSEIGDLASQSALVFANGAPVIAFPTLDGEAVAFVVGRRADTGWDLSRSIGFPDAALSTANVALAELDGRVHLAMRASDGEVGAIRYVDVDAPSSEPATIVSGRYQGKPQVVFVRDVPVVVFTNKDIIHTPHVARLVDGAWVVDDVIDLGGDEGFAAGAADDESLHIVSIDRNAERVRYRRCP